YDDARAVFNAMIDRRPALIAQCETPFDVAKAIRFGRQLGLEIAVRAAGHSLAGHCVADGGVVIDLRRMSAVAVDPVAGTAHGGGGNFGVAVSLSLALHPLPAVTIALLAFRPEAGPEVLRGYRDFLAAAPDEVGGGLLFITGPPRPFVPEPLVGRLICAMLVT